MKNGKWRESLGYTEKAIKDLNEGKITTESSPLYVLVMWEAAD